MIGLLPINDNLESFFIDNNTIRIDKVALGNNKQLKEIVVEDSNPVFTSYDGLLCSKDLTRLHFCPPNKSIINIPKTIIDIDKDAFDYISCEIEEFNHPPLFFDGKDNIISPEALKKLCIWLNPKELHIDYKKSVVNYLMERIIKGEAQTEHKKAWCKYINSIKNRIYKNPRVDLTTLTALLCREKLLKLSDIKVGLDIARRRNNARATSILLSYQNANFSPEQINKKSLNELNKGIEQLKKDWRFGFKNDTTIFLSGYKGLDTDICVPSEIGRSHVSTLQYFAFSPIAPNIVEEERNRRDRIETVVINNPYIKELPYNLFDSCRSLESVTLPDSLKIICEASFKGCIKLDNVKLPDSIEEIRDTAFACCVELKNITLPKNLKVLKEGAFTLCKSLKKIYLSDSIEELGCLCFSGCESLEEVNIPPLIESVPSCFFKNCKALKTITIPSNIKGIESSAFSGCTSLEKVCFIDTDNFNALAFSSFESCESLISISLPKDITYLHHSTFANCKSLKEVLLPTNLQVIGEENCKRGVFEGCSSLETIVIPEGVTTIGKNTFKNCTRLKNIVLPSSVTSLSEGVFYGCISLESVTLSENIKTIGSRCFYGCRKLNYLYLPDMLEYLPQDCFVDSGITSLSFPNKKITVGEDCDFNIEDVKDIKITIRED